MINAAAPITGGISWAPVAATAVIAPAFSLLYPRFSIIGIVRVPVIATLPAAEPDIIPINRLKIMAVLAVAATNFLVREEESLNKNSPAPNSLKKAP